MKRSVLLLITCLGISYSVLPGQEARHEILLPQTGVSFKTSDALLQRVFNEAERYSRLNIKNFGKYEVMVEGGGYSGVYLETQPIGGAMYAKRNTTIAQSNQLIFMDYQRDDGRLPGSVYFRNGVLVPRYLELQGNYLPLEAFDVYYWAGKEVQYLRKLYETLKKYDSYLWKYRDSDNNGCLETWCIFDTGEDHNSRFGDAYASWPFSFAPTPANLKNLSEQDSLVLCSDIYNRCTGSLKYNSPMPIESMDVMSYSYANRYILARISEILQNGQDIYWYKKAKEVQEKISNYLWIPAKHACYDRDKNNEVMDILIHNNLRCMYFGSFSQEMADEFIKYHLLNPSEFWTPMPLPSIAVSDPFFRNIPENNWSGQPQGLTYQRSIRALENYGHYAELTMIGEKFLKAIGSSFNFPQQFDPFNKAINSPQGKNGYGPSVLASLEFISKLYGISMAQDKISWSCLDNNYEYEYAQKLGDLLFSMKSNGKRVFCFINGSEIFSFSKGIRVVSDIKGNLIEVAGIGYTDSNACINYKGNSFSFLVKPNTIYAYQQGFKKTDSVEFYRPDHF